MKGFFILSLTLFFLQGCKKDYGAPDCIETKITEFKKSQPICEDGAEVTEYRFQGEIVYKFNSGNCIADNSYSVYNEYCVKLGELGGIVGNTRINGEKFSNAIYLRTVWKR